MGEGSPEEETGNLAAEGRQEEGKVSRRGVAEVVHRVHQVHQVEGTGERAFLGQVALEKQRSISGKRSPNPWNIIVETYEAAWAPLPVDHQASAGTVVLAFLPVDLIPMSR